jgi:hypothetical protein
LRRGCKWVWGERRYEMIFTFRFMFLIQTLFDTSFPSFPLEANTSFLEAIPNTLETRSGVIAFLASLVTMYTGILNLFMFGALRLR